MRKPLLVCVLALAAPAAGPPASITRLPDGVRPLRYQASLTVDPEDAVLAGEITVEMRLARPRREITLNATDLEFLEAHADGGTNRVAAQATPERGEFVTLSFAKPLPAGPARVTLRYRGKLSEDLSAGAFRRRSPEGDWYVYTTFTAIDARRVFPCFDQPDFKTPWQLTLTVPDGQMALANTAAVSETRNADGSKTVRFAETVALPTELVAFAVGPFDLLEAGTAGRQSTPMRVVAPRGRAGEGTLAAEIARTVLPRLEEYTGIGYAFGKLDHMALLQGAYGGVENPGLIQYLGRLLLAPPEQAAARRQDLEGLMAHEMAHQWFGNYVTQGTWKDVWLSEGLTTWLGHKIADMSLPAAERGLRAAASREEALRQDGGRHARAVRVEWETREQMRQVYGGIVYSKGAAFVSMLEGWLGADTVQRAVRRYLRDHPYGNATTADFVRAVRRESGRDIGGMAAALLDRAGAPVVSARLVCGAGRPRLALTAAAYAAPGSAPAGGRWTIPVCARTEFGTDCLVLGTATGELPLATARACPAWVFPNAGGNGYYRLSMEAPSLQRLAGAHDALTPVERLTLVEEMLSMVRAGTLPAGDALPLLAVFSSDPESGKAVRDAARFIAQLVPDSLRKAYREYARRTLGVEIDEPAGGDDSLAPLRAIHASSLSRLLSSL